MIRLSSKYSNINILKFFFLLTFSRLHLVLIKSKLDQLNHAQPLKPFPDIIGNIQSMKNILIYISKYIIISFRYNR